MESQQVEIFEGAGPNDLQTKINAFLSIKRKYKLRILHVTQSSSYTGSSGAYIIISIFYVLEN